MDFCLTAKEENVECVKLVTAKTTKHETSLLLVSAV